MSLTMKQRVKAIRVFRSPLSDNWYASRAWKQEPNGMVTITGQKFDVTAEVEFFIAKAGYISTAEADHLRARVSELEAALREIARGGVKPTPYTTTELRSLAIAALAGSGGV